MGRILFWLVVGLLCWLLIRISLGSSRKTGRNNETGKTDDEQRNISMAQCAYCGIHFPRSEGVTSEDGRVFCSQPHCDAAHRAHAS